MRRVFFVFIFLIISFGTTIAGGGNLFVGAETKASKKINQQLRAAATSGDVNLVKKLLDAGVSPNSIAGDYGTHVLQVAAYAGRKEIVEILLQAGADVNLKSDHLRTALMEAALGGHASIVNRLLQAKADPNAENEDGETAIIFAAFQPHLESIDVIKALAAAGADLNHQTKSGSFWIGATALVHAVVANNEKAVKALIALGSNLGIRTKNGETALAVAIRLGNSNLAEYLKMADPEMKGMAEAELLRTADAGNLIRVRELVAGGADVNAQDPHGTSLMKASAHGFIEIVRFLLEKGADHRIRTKVESTFEMDATGNGVLIQSGGKTALHFAVESGQPVVVQELIKAAADVNQKTQELRIPVKAKKGFLEAAARSAQEKTSLGKAGRTSLHMAIERGDIEIVKILVAAGSNLSVSDFKGKTPLQIARESGKKQIAELLAKAGAAK